MRFLRKMLPVSSFADYTEAARQRLKPDGDEQKPIDDTKTLHLRPRSQHDIAESLTLLAMWCGWRELDCHFS